MRIRHIAIAMILSACGTSQPQPYPEPPPPRPQPPNPDPGGDELSFTADVQPLLNSFCKECHSDATFMASEAGFLNSRAPTRIANKSMPPQNAKNYAKWGDAQRGLIAKFVQDNK